MLETRMLGNPNLVANGENCLGEVTEIEQYYIKDGKLYCYGLDDNKLVRDENRKLKTYIFDIDEEKDTIKKVKNKNNFVMLVLVDLFVLFVGFFAFVGVKQMELGLFMVFFIVFVNIMMIKADNKLFHKCQEFYALHKNEIKVYNS